MDRQVLRRGYRRFKLLSAAALAAVLSFAMLGGCSSAPYFEVESYEQIQAEMADHSGIIYPDISKYQKEGLTYWIGFDGGGCSKMVKTGYSVRTGKIAEHLDGRGASTVFSTFSIGCYKIEYLSAPRNPRREVQPNMTYRGIGIEYYEGSINNSDGTPPEFLPEGAKLGSVSCEFDLNGYWYVINPQLVITSDELINTTFDEEISKAKAELFVVIDDILDKGGVPR